VECTFAEVETAVQASMELPVKSYLASDLAYVRIKAALKVMGVPVTHPSISAAFGWGPKRKEPDEAHCLKIMEHIMQRPQTACQRTTHSLYPCAVVRREGGDYFNKHHRDLKAVYGKVFTVNHKALTEVERGKMTKQEYDRCMVQIHHSEQLQHELEPGQDECLAVTVPYGLHRELLLGLDTEGTVVVERRFPAEPHQQRPGTAALHQQRPGTVALLPGDVLVAVHVARTRKHTFKSGVSTGPSGSTPQNVHRLIKQAYENKDKREGVVVLDVVRRSPTAQCRLSVAVLDPVSGLPL